MIRLETTKPAFIEKDPARIRSLLSTNYRRAVYWMEFFPVCHLYGCWKDFRQLGSLWGITRFLRNLSSWFTTPARAWHAKSYMLARSTLALSFLLESGRNVFYDHFCSFWLLTDYKKDYSQREKRNPVDTVDTIAWPQLCWWLGSPLA